MQGYGCQPAFKSFARLTPRAGCTAATSTGCCTSAEGAVADACAALLQALVRWGGAMLELAHFKQGAEADDYIKEVQKGGAGWGSHTG
jgi:hypothetical protein